MGAEHLLLAAVVLAFGQACHSSPGIVPNAGQIRTRETARDSLSPPWTKIPTTQLAKVPLGAADSVITVRRRSTTTLDVIYAFNNSCESSMEAFTQREGDTVSIRFLMHLPNEGGRSDSDLPLCSAAIVVEAFQVTIENASRGALIVRAFAGDGKNWGLIRERASRD